MNLSFLTRLKTAAAVFPRAFDEAWNEYNSPRFNPATEIGRLLQTTPRPLINPKARFIVIFSAKSACSSVAIWFFNQLGHLEAAQDFHRWPHEYRRNVYYRSKLYENAFRRDLSKLRVIRIMRDPYSRAVSSYRHVLGHDYAYADIARALRRSDIAENGFSFAEFLDYLEGLDLTNCDVHCRIQRHPVEDHLPVRQLINVSTENLFTRLNEVEARWHLPRTDFSAIPWINQVNERRTARGSLEDLTNVDTRRFTQLAAREGPWAPYEAFLTPAARERIARLYAVDLESYPAGGRKPQRAPDRAAGAAAVRVIRTPHHSVRLET